MKKLFGIILIVSLSFNILSATRHDLYRQFGPKLIEAIVIVIKNEINLLRTEHGLSERTNQQIMNAVESELSTVPDYDWMGGHI